MKNLKKIALALVLVFAISSVSFAGLRIGKLGIEYENLLIGNPIGANNATLTQIPGLFYQFTEDLSGTIGLIYSSGTNGTDPDKSDTNLGLKLKGIWNLGSGKTVPHLGAELGYLAATNGEDDDKSSTKLQLAILYGVEVLWLPSCSILLDVRILDYVTSKKKGDDKASSTLAILSGTTLGIRWYIL